MRAVSAINLRRAVCQLQLGQQGPFSPLPGVLRSTQRRPSGSGLAWLPSLEMLSRSQQPFVKTKPSQIQLARGRWSFLLVSETIPFGPY